MTLLLLRKVRRRTRLRRREASDALNVRGHFAIYFVRLLNLTRVYDLACLHCVNFVGLDSTVFSVFLLLTSLGFFYLLVKGKMNRRAFNLAFKMNKRTFNLAFKMK